ncbi:esterase [Actinoplanes lobatus]|uniref:Esterase n=1 Tax=Actinoplanes lobatus TaxID=113568 RepID=A0A7W7MJG9_9ACTN|nr:alpha/beta hydrolase [Actinoplanes lobatus]MBB4752569.1 acetyl esterase/lipase [Actinoplanes lobatus]GGN97895.1 esterase [Actinoplanes lobatus]GIE45845.1 esterase [Actinoplanes lobatus]
MRVTVEDRRIDGPHGPIPVRVYTPDGQAGAGLVWAHGGAFFGGDLDMPESDWVARQLAERGIAVVAVDYRLAPVLDWTTGEQAPVQPGERFHYPVASEELVAAFAWAGASDTGVRGWVLGGASAGANLAAGATLRLRDDGRPLPRGVLLVYPVLHTELPPMTAELAAKVATLPDPDLVGAGSIRRMNLNYVREPSDLNEPYAFPGGHDLTGLPPTFILNSDVDPLRASGQQYGAELAAAGVDLVMIREDGVHHGHLNEPHNPAAVRSLARMADWLLSPALISPPTCGKTPPPLH